MKKNRKLGEKKEVFLFVLLFSLTAYRLSLTAVFGATADVSVDCANDLAPISPYVYGHNTSNYYCMATLTNPEVKQALRDINMGMLRFPAGACMQRFDFKYNNYEGRMWNTGTTMWDTNCPSIEDELQFCHDVGAEPLVGLNVSFSGPNGTSGDDYDNHSNDYASYTGCYLPDTPENRAKYAADMVSYIRSLCASKGWTPPVYYDVGNEYMCDGQSASTYTNHFVAYYNAIKAVDPDARLLPGLSEGGSSMISQIGDKMYAFGHHTYGTLSGIDYDNYTRYRPGIIDGSFSSKSQYSTNLMQNARDLLAQSFPGLEVRMVETEWGDHWDDTVAHFRDYQGAIFTAHMTHRCIKNKVLISCAWDLQSDWRETYALFSPTYLPFKPRPRYYVYKMYTNFGDTLLECYDPAEYTPGETNYFTQYKDERDDLIVIASRRSDGNIAIMATNLSRTDSYNTTINIANFSMGGEVVAYTMDQSNCYEGGPGPSSEVLTGKGSPMSYTFAPFTVTCLVVKGIFAGPIISDISVSDITETGATITWDTDVPATTRVEYGPTKDYGSSTNEDSTLVTSHSVSLTGLSGEYHYRVISKDADQEENKSVDYTFMTLIEPAAKVTLEADRTSLPADNQTTTLITGYLKNLQNQIDKTITSGTFTFSVSPSNMGSLWQNPLTPGDTRDVQEPGKTYIIFKAGTTPGEVTVTGNFGSLTPGCKGLSESVRTQSRQFHEIYQFNF
jgi:hypothetical protein